MDKEEKNVVIDQDECIGCESCVELCPEIFEFDQAEEKAHVGFNYYFQRLFISHCQMMRMGAG